jgi:DNA-binding NarL/FixJ family response regulator
MTIKCVWGEHSLCNDGCGCVCHLHPEAFAEFNQPPSPRGLLSPKESKIAALVGEGFRAREIADEFITTEQTIKNALKNIYRKLGLQDDGRICQHVKLGIYWNCELFQRGLAA